MCGAKNAHINCKYNYHARYHLTLMLIDVGKQFFCFTRNLNGTVWYYRNAKRRNYFVDGVQLWGA